MSQALRFPKQTLSDVDVAGKTVLVRVDYNVPLDDDGRISDDSRIRASLPTIHHLLEQDAKVVLCAHLGRPGGKPDEKLSLAIVGQALANLLERPIEFVKNSVGDEVYIATAAMRFGQVALLENLRFQPGEEADDPEFAAQLVKDTHAEVFVQDGFGVVHRQSATTSAITRFLPSVAGLLLEKEWQMIEGVLHNAKRPLVSVLGGAKISDKLPLIKQMLQLSDTVVVGGALANGFLHYLGFAVGESLLDPGATESVGAVLAQARSKFGDRLVENFLLPVDIAVTTQGQWSGARVNRPLYRQLSGQHSKMKIGDLGEKSIARLEKVLPTAGTVIWNGTLGVAQYPEWAAASNVVAKTLAYHPRINSLICGGDTVAFVTEWQQGHHGEFKHLSTGGGAAIALLAGEPMPGIANLAAK